GELLHGRQPSLSAISGLNSFDHLVGGHLHDHRHCEAKRLCGLEIEDEIKIRRLYYGQISCPGAFENQAEVNTGLAISVVKVGCVAHEAPIQNKLAPEVHRRNFVPRSERDKLFAAAIEQRVDGDEQDTGL